MSDIGLRLFQQLKSIDNTANKDDYFDDDKRQWDLEGLEEDLKNQQERLTQQQRINNISNNTTNNDQHSNNYNSSSTENTQSTINNSQQSLISNSNITPINNVNINNNNNNNNNNNSNNDDNPNANDLKHQLPKITQDKSDGEEDIDLHHNNNNNLIVSHSDTTNPSQMPSPNASPSIGADYANDTDNNYNSTQEINNNQQQQPLLTNNNHSNIHLNDNVTRNDNNNHHQNNNNNIQQQPKRTKSKSPSKSPSRKVRTNKSKSPSKSPSTKKSKGGRKRKSVEYSPTSSSTLPPSKKQKKSVSGYSVKNKWNEAALKKLYSLKRQVKNSGWFWEPVDEIRHSAINYYLVCQLPSDYGTICKRLENHQYNDLDVFLRDCELVFINARMYNMPVHPVHKASMDLERKFKELMNTFVEQHCEKYGSQYTLTYWQKARRDYKPFAVPVDD